MASTDLTDRFAGCLLGQALGDALGFVVEGQTAAVCGPYLQRWQAAGGALHEARAPWSPGQYSDDTQLARELAASLVARRGFEPGDYAARIARLFAQGRVVGHGPSTLAAAERLAQGVPWHEAGTPGPVAGNGGAMRVAPLALLLAGDLPALRVHAGDQARITHADPRCLAGARVIARAVAAVLRGEDDVPWLCEELAQWADEPVLAAALLTLPCWLRSAPEEAAAELLSTGVERGSGRYGVAPHVTPSVLWSVYAALRHPRDYAAAVHLAVMPGGDVDTTAAMTGAIVGAAVGLQGLPASRTAVHDSGEHGHDALCALAEQLRRCARPGA